MNNGAKKPQLVVLIIYEIILTVIGIILLWWVSTLPLQQAVMLGLVAYIQLLMGRMRFYDYLSVIFLVYSIMSGLRMCTVI